MVRYSDPGAFGPHKQRKTILRTGKLCFTTVWEPSSNTGKIFQFGFVAVILLLAFIVSLLNQAL